MQKINCVNCGSNTILPVEYGTPNEDMIQRIEQGQILHGGCANSRSNAITLLSRV